MRVAVACIALTGCQLVFQAENPCVFSEAIPLAGLTDPTLKAPILDGDTLWFIAETPDEKIRFASLGTDDTLGSPTIARITVDDTHENDFGMSGDGLRLVFSTDEGQVFEVARPDRMSPFVQPPKPISLAPVVEGLDLSFDGLTIIFQNENDLLFAATRPDLETSFDTIVPILDETGAQVPGKVPSLSRDGLELLFELNDGIRRRTRPSLDEPFSLIEELIIFGDDPELSNDGLSLIFLPESKDHFEILRRECR